MILVVTVKKISNPQDKRQAVTPISLAKLVLRVQENDAAFLRDDERHSSFHIFQCVLVLMFEPTI
jgi:hypothetical protein